MSEMDDFWLLDVQDRPLGRVILGDEALAFLEVNWRDVVVVPTIRRSLEGNEHLVGFRCTLVPADESREERDSAAAVPPEKPPAK